MATTTTQKISSKIPNLLRRQVQVTDTFCQASSRLFLYTSAKSTYVDDDALFFIGCAVHYLLQGKTFKEICEHNSRIANQLGRPSVGYTWVMIRNIFASTYFDLDDSAPGEEFEFSDFSGSLESVKEVFNASDEDKIQSYSDGKNDENDNYHNNNNNNNNNNYYYYNDNGDGTVDTVDAVGDNDVAVNNTDDVAVDNTDYVAVNHNNSNNNDPAVDRNDGIHREGDDTGLSNNNNNNKKNNNDNDSDDKDSKSVNDSSDTILDERSEQSDDDDLKQHSPDEFLTDGCYMPGGDFIFGDREMDPFCLDYDTCENLYFSINGIFADKFDLDENEWNLPCEAFAPRHEIKEGPLPPELLPTKIPSFTSYVNSFSRDKFVKSDDGPYILTIKHKGKLPVWNTSELISEALRQHANRGDFQTAVSVLLVLGEKRKFLTRRTALDEMVQEQWLLAYLEMLNRYKLWNITTKVIQLSWVSSVYQLNQLSTSLRTCCGKCHKVMLKCGWSCDRCGTRVPSICALCHQVVKGMFAWCQGCGHGGHIIHIRAWVRESKYCPAGCGHFCEY